jgi:hypothetical protein
MLEDAILNVFIAEVYLEPRRIQMYTLAPIKRHKITHTVSIEKTVILVFVECYESLKVLILVQQGVAGRGGDLRRIRRTR